jgi:putative DNA-invertase from lambdoid prophage Rac
VDLVLVWKLDRFARSALDALQWLQQLDGYGVGFKILTQEIDTTTTAAGRLVFTILAAVAEMERELISERVAVGMARAKVKGKPIGQARRRMWMPEEHELWPVVLEGLRTGSLTRKLAARRLKVRYQDLAMALERSESRVVAIQFEKAV